MVHLLTDRDEISLILLNTVVVYTDALNLVISQRIQGDGGAALIANLGKAVARVHANDAALPTKIQAN